MAENNGLYSIEGSTLTEIADAIREKRGTTRQYSPSEMASAVLTIQGGGAGALPNNLAYLDQTIEDQAFIGYGSTVTVDKTGADVEEINPIFQALYPIGSIYMSVTYFDPATVFGGVWEQIQDTFLLAAGSTYAAGATGGEATHTLTVNEMPSHTHHFVANGGHFGSYDSTQIGAAGTAYADRPGFNIGMDWGGNGMISLQETGGGAAHNNMPPYLVVYVWKRTA